LTDKKGIPYLNLRVNCCWAFQGMEVHRLGTLEEEEEERLSCHKQIMKN
jgi:hypothetical protein